MQFLHSSVVIGALLAIGTATLAAQMSGIAVVRHAPSISGAIEGSVQQLIAEGTDLGGSASISGDLLVPGSPALLLSGHPHFGGVIDGPGSAAPSNYQISLTGHSELGRLIRRTDAIALPIAVAAQKPTGTRHATIASAEGSAGSFFTLRDLTLD